jgi:hypothetical protein
VVFTSDGCEGKPEEIRFLEHVEVLTNIDYTMRGALEMHLTSPSGGWCSVLSITHIEPPEECCLLFTLPRSIQDIGLCINYFPCQCHYFAQRMSEEVIVKKERNFCTGLDGP